MVEIRPKAVAVKSCVSQYLHARIILLCVYIFGRSPILVVGQYCYGFEYDGV